ncbi:hypothetical protein PPYR_01566 [Photinus pyralis]|uniref:PiggyBac transposable element-derived protein domain-containing protein n=1 Tax=Photinus pyralis TaxID=7054 RepID=A0A5N4B4V9_PHOPY|nr:hypothetical protein PPYR_01566 [Photinus pyralis]
MKLAANSGVADFIKNLNNPTPGKLFQVFFDDGLLEHIVFQTNLYANQTNLQKSKSTSITPTTKCEFMAFLGINILMGIKVLPSYRDHWSSSPDLHDPYISQLMNVNRFSWILGNLHLNDNEVMPKKGQPGFDKLFKLRPFLDVMQQKFEACFSLTECGAIDESMIKFKGRSSLKQYLPKKPIKRGFKVWCLADGSGYLSKFQIYTGKQDNNVEKALGPRVVKDLCSGLENKGHRIYFDNYFSSVNLLHDLKDKKINACGTINKNRKHLPTFSSDKQLKRGDYDYFVNNKGIATTKWKDKRAVFLISNFHNPQDTTTVKRKARNGSIEDVPCPIMLTDYNAHMNAVDKFDQKKSSYEIDRKSRKWWHRIFFYFVDACIVNSYIIYEKLGLPKMTLKNFRRKVVEHLVCETLTHTNTKKRRSNPVVAAIREHKPYVPDNIRQREAAHLPIRSSRRRCGHCSTKSKQVRTKWMCTMCKVPLCLKDDKNCFIPFHKK